jgi:hypothetical protein
MWKMGLPARVKYAFLARVFTEFHRQKMLIAAPHPRFCFPNSCFLKPSPGTKDRTLTENQTPAGDGWFSLRREKRGLRK